MVFKLATTQVSKNNASTKDKIVLILGQEFPLTAKQIFNRLKKEFNANLSYQAAHKLLHQLTEEKVLLREEKNYSLNKQWIKQVKTFGSNLENSYLKKAGNNYLQDLEKHGTVNVTLVGIRETARFLIDGFFRLPNPQKKPNIALWRNVYSIIGLNDADYDGLKETLPQWFAVSSENNFLDKMFADTLSKFGMKVKLGVKEAATSLSDTFVTGDYVGVIFYPPKFRELWHRQNKLPQKVNEFDLHHHFKMMIDEKATINALITKNPDLADQIREKYMKHFKEGKK
ncbi:MAG: hypothetical protein HYW50_01790 [Candidatus Diapherotrites archaeon]|nr:hypothetical protein [Candidatus Diapherotrites archaeon]